MFVKYSDNSIYATRGDAVYWTAEKVVDGAKYEFQPGDTVRIKIMGKKSCDKVYVMKDFTVEESSTGVNIFLDKNEMKFGDIISKPTDYWYELELNPDTTPDTFIGYSDEGPALFKLFPEAKDVTEGEIPDPGENSAVSKMVVTFVHEYLDSHTDMLIKEILKEESLQTIIDHILKENNMDSIVQEIIKEGNIETIVQEIVNEGHLETIVQEVIKEENLETIVKEIIKGDNIEKIVQEMVKEENLQLIVDRVLEEIADSFIEAGVNGATFTPHVDQQGNLWWTNNGGLANPEMVNIRGEDGKDGVTFTPNVDANGNLSWSNDGGLENPPSVNIGNGSGGSGEQGPPGEDGYTPVKGVDYFTEEDKTELVEDVLDRFPCIKRISVNESTADNTVTIYYRLDDDSAIRDIITLNDNGYPTNINANGTDIPVAWEVG